MPGKMARSDPRPSVRVTRGAGSGQHLASVLQEGRENANIDAGLRFIWRISAKSRRCAGGSSSLPARGAVPASDEAFLKCGGVHFILFPRLGCGVSGDGLFNVGVGHGARGP
jgi:hypothetical protein